MEHQLKKQEAITEKQRRKILKNRINKPFVKNHMFCEMKQH